MKTLLRSGLLAAAVVCAGGAPARAVDQADIDRAVERGVAALRQMQNKDGTWPYSAPGTESIIGPTALAGLTLLECGVKADDKAVQAAAEAVRQASIRCTHTYSLALSILFLDLLGDRGDVPLIESMTVRLLAGQSNAGGWTYNCPDIGEGEVRRLTTVVGKRKEGTERREPSAGGGKRGVKDLPAEIQEQLVLVDRMGGAVHMRGVGGDNSNTQFATLALWVARRHGLPVEKALARIDARFRSTQLPDGGWSYTPIQQMMPQQPILAGHMPGMGSTATMTCAGLLGLAVADGAVLEMIREKKPGAKPRDVSKDQNLTRGLMALGAVVENPQNLRFDPFPFPRNDARRVAGRTYYFFWSLERVAVALDLNTIGKKDWYGWGAEVLLANQTPQGTWVGDYGDNGVDTCFALLFLRRANLARDLTASLTGRIKDPGAAVLRGGGVGGEALSGDKSVGGIKSGIERKGGKPRPLTKPPGGGGPKLSPEEAETARLADGLVRAPAERRAEALDKLRGGKGVAYTEALAAAIPRLEGEAQKQARSALAERLVRMKAETLAKYMDDEDPEIRRAAALACGTKEIKELVPHLILLLRDPEVGVARAAHAALKALTGQDFGPAARASREDRDRASQRWLEWWGKQARP
jgi:hypothetical protein